MVWPMVFSFETPQNEEAVWLRKVYHRSMDKIKFNFGYSEPFEKQRNEMRAHMGTIRSIARKKNPKVVSSLDVIEELANKRLSNKISDKTYVDGLIRIGKKHGLKNEIMHHLESLNFDKSVKSKYLDTKNPLLNAGNAFAGKGYNPSLDYGGNAYKVGMGGRNVFLDMEKNSPKKVSNSNASNKFLSYKNPLLEHSKKVKKTVQNNVLLSARNPFLDYKKSGASHNPGLTVKNVFLDMDKKSPKHYSRVPSQDYFLNFQNPLLGKQKKVVHHKTVKNVWLDYKNPLLGGK